MCAGVEDNIINNIIHVHKFYLDDLTILTKFLDNGDDGEDGIYLNQEIIINSYGNSATLNLNSVSFTPDMLRRLANELDRAQIQAVALKVKND